MYKTGCLGRGFKGSCLSKGIPCRSYTEGQSGRATIQGSQSNLRCAARERSGPTTVSSVPYVNDIWRNTDSNIRLFADDCIIYGKITNKKT